MKLYLVKETHDPYEPRDTIAVCTSREQVVRLVPEAYEHVTTHCELDPPDNKNGFIDYAKSYQEWRHIQSGEIKRYAYQDFGPDIFIEEVETDVRLDNQS